MLSSFQMLVWLGPIALAVPVFAFLIGAGNRRAVKALRESGEPSDAVIAAAVLFAWPVCLPVACAVFCAWAPVKAAHTLGSRRRIPKAVASEKDDE